MTTALELPREAWQTYIENARHRSSLPALSPAEQETHEHLVKKAHEAASILKNRFEAKRVVLFGSLAHRAWYIEESDIDMAVEGLKPKSYWEAWRTVEELFDGRPVDLVSVETARPSILQAIARYGIEL